jgi:predicted RND superfamily exporter protein
MNSKKNVRPRAAWLTTNVSSIASVFKAIIQLKMGWLMPLVVILFLVALTLALLSAAGPLAPFVYPLF